MIPRPPRSTLSPYTTPFRSKGQLRLSNANDATKWLTFDLTSRTTHTGYREFALTNTGSSSANPFADGDALLLEFTRTGGSEAHTAELQSRLHLACRLLLATD